MLKRFWGCFKVVSEVFQGFFDGVSRKFQISFKQVKWTFQEGYKEVSRVFQECFIGVSRNFLVLCCILHGTHHSYPPRWGACLPTCIHQTLGDLHRLLTLFRGGGKNACRHLLR